jgi:hypothetical protein
MLAAVNARRFAVAGAVLAAVATLGFSCSSPLVPDCGFPSLSEKAADGGPDPCHCDPPPSLNLAACPCLSGIPQEVDEYNGCMFIYRGELEAGVDGG